MLSSIIPTLRFKLKIQQIGFLAGVYSICTFLLPSSQNDLLFISGSFQVLHGLSGDAANLYRQFNITLRNVYDTQVNTLKVFSLT